MAVIRSLKRTPTVLLKHPIVFLPVLVFTVLQLAGQVPQLLSIDPVISALVSLALTGLYIFVMPFFQGGMIGIANDAATDGRPSIGRFLTHGKENYLSLLGAYVFVVVLSIGFGFLIMIGVFVGVLSVAAAEGNALVTAAIGIVALVVGLLSVAVFVAIQFYSHAIVLENERAVDSFRRSVAVVRNNLFAVGGYLLVSIVGGGLSGGAYAAVYLQLIPPAASGEPAPTPDLVPAIVGLGGSAVLLTVFGTVFLVFSVLFYRSIVGLDESDAAAGAAGTSGASSTPSTL